MASSPTTSFGRSLDKFREKLSDRQKREFSCTKLEDVEAAIQTIQARLGPAKRLRNFARVRKFLEGMQHVEQLVTIFLNVHEVVAFVWGPIKFALLIATARVDAAELLLDACGDIGEVLHGLGRYDKLFRNHDEARRILEVYFYDVLEFHQCVLDVFARSVWKRFFDSAWPTFRSRFMPILDSLKRHRALLSDEKITAVLEEVQEARSTADARFSELSDEIRNGLKEIKEVLNEKQAVLRDSIHDQKAAMTAKLNAPEYKADQLAAASQRLLPSSGDWFFLEPAVIEWLHGTNSASSILYLSGSPGCGKTTLVSRIVDYIKSRQQELGGSVVYFYFKYRDPSKRSMIAMLRAIVSQLMDQDNLLLEHLHRKWANLGDSEELSNISFLKALAIDCLATQHRVWLMLDGLDECDEDLSATLQWLQNLNQSSLSGSGEAHVRLLFAGQRDGNIDERLLSCPEVRLDRVDSHSRDVEEYTKVRAFQLRERFLLDSTGEEKVAQRIKDSSKGMFLYAKVVLDNLFNQDSIAEFETEMSEENFPEGLDAAYERIAVCIIDRQPPPRRRSATDILSWVLCAARPLYWREIQSRFCIDAEMGSCNFQNRRLNSCKKTCGALVEVEPCEHFGRRPSEQPIRLVHETAGQYLVHTRRIDLYEQQAKIALFCSRYLLSEPCRDGLPSREVEIKARSGYYGFQDYAVAHWRHHVESAISTAPAKVSSDRRFEVVYSATQVLDVWRSQPSISGAEAESNLPGPAVRSPSIENLKTVESQWEAGRDDALPALEARTATIRKTIEYLMAKVELSNEAPDAFLDLYGAPRFKCPKVHCERFTIGFLKLKLRDTHVLEHERPFKCADESCFARTTGFPSQAALREHSRRFHPNEKSAHSVFPGISKMKESSIFTACKEGNLEEVKRYHLSGSDPNSLQNARGAHTPLLLATRGGHVLVCKYLLENGADPYTERLDYSPLKEAINRRDAQLWQLLYSKLSGNVRDAAFASSISGAILTGNPQLLDLMMTGKSSADLQGIGADVMKALCFLPGQGFRRHPSFFSTDAEIVHSWFKRAYPILYQPDSLEILPDALREGQDPLLDQARDALTRSYSWTFNRSTPLHIALQYERHLGSTFILDFIGTGELQKQDKDGNTPLHVLCIRAGCMTEDPECDGCSEIAQRLIIADDGASANFTNSAGELPLYCACQRGSKSLVEILVSHTKDLNRRTRSGNAAINVAAGKNFVHIVRVLLASGRINLSNRNSAGRTVFSSSVVSGASIEILQLLRGASAPIVWLPDESSERLTPLHYALQLEEANDFTRTIQFLLGLPEVEEILEHFMKNGTKQDNDASIAQLLEFAEDRDLEGAIAALVRYHRP